MILDGLGYPALESCFYAKQAFAAWPTESRAVIASVAKQSRAASSVLVALDCFATLAMTVRTGFRPPANANCLEGASYASIQTKATADAWCINETRKADMDALAHNRSECVNALAVRPQRDRWACQRTTSFRDYRIGALRGGKYGPRCRRRR